MARWRITVAGKALRKTTLDKLLGLVKDQWGDKVSVSVDDATPPESRSDRFEEAKGTVSDAKSMMEELRDELQEWRDNLPENLSGSEKAEQLETAISELENCIDSLDTIEGTDVEFPAMM